MKSLPDQSLKLLEKFNTGSGYKMNMSDKWKMKMFGTTDEEMMCWTSFRRLGITFDEFKQGNEIIASEPAHPCHNKRKITKLEKLTGHSEEQIKRSVALAVLGTTENEMFEVLAKKLGSIGRVKSNRK